MRINGGTPISELMHGEPEQDADIRYIDLDEGELAHWKYIKKEKVNGKWRYYYTQSQLEEARVDAEKAKAQYSTDSDVAGKALLGSILLNNDTAKKTYAAAKAKADESKKQAEAAAKNYESMKLSSVAAKTINRGITILKNFFLTRR